MTGSVSPPQGIISREQGNRTKAGEGGRCVFPSFFVPSSTSWPGHLPFFWHVLLFLPSSFVLASRRRLFIFPRKKKKRIRPPSVQDRHLFPFGKKPGKANVEYTILRPLFVFVFFRFEKHFLFSREAVFFVPSAKCVSLPSLKKRKRKEGNCHAVGIRRQEGGAAILLAFSSGKTFPPFFQKRKRKKRREHRNPSSRMEAFPVSGREKKRKKRKKGILLSAGLPSLGKERREKAGVSILWSGSSLLQKKGNASRCGIRKRRKGKPSPAHRGESPLAFISEKRKEEGSVFVLSSFLRCSSASRHCQKKEKTSFELRAEEKEEKRSTVLSLPSLLFRMFSLLHSSKRREAASNRYAGRSKRC